MEKKEKKDLTIQQRLIEVQTELKVPKGNYNSFGKYKYRSAEDILEAVKPLLKKHEVLFTITDDIIQIGNKMFIKAFANICYNNQTTITKSKKLKRIFLSYHKIKLMM